MPTYQYACAACGEQLEAVQSFSDEPLKVCPACGGELRKRYSAVGIVFKGSGFYRNDSRSGNSSSAPSSAPPASDSSSSTSKSSTSTATPAAPKPDATKPAATPSPA